MSFAAHDNSNPNQQQAASFEAQFAECLALLEGPTDERRFVGLLLVTKLLPHGDQTAIQKVYSAVGHDFLTRLILPLKKPLEPAAQATTAEALQKQVGTVALGLSIISTMAQLPEIASECVEYLPLVINVIKAGGVAPALGYHGRFAADNVDPATELCAVIDALHIAVGVVSADFGDGAKVARQSGVLGAVCAVLQRPFVKEQFEAKLWALKLASGVLSPDKADERKTIINAHAEEIECLIPPLAHILSSPSRSSSPPGSPSKQLDTQQSVTLQLESLTVLLLIFPIPDPTPLHYRLSRAAPTSSWARDMRKGIDTILRGRTAAAQRHGALQLAGAMTDVAGSGWLAGGDGSFYQLVTEIVKIEVGVLLLDALAPKVPVPNPAFATMPSIAVSNDSKNGGGVALQNAAAHCSSNLSSAVGGGGSGPSGYQQQEPSNVSNQQQYQFQESDLDRTTTGELATAMSFEMLDADTTTGDFEKCDTLVEGPADLHGLRQALTMEHDSNKDSGSMAQLLRDMSMEDEQKQQQRPPTPGETAPKVDAVQIPNNMQWNQGPIETSGERASRMLPICFSLLETAIDVLITHEEELEHPPIKSESECEYDDGSLDGEYNDHELESFEDSEDEDMDNGNGVAGGFFASIIAAAAVKKTPFDATQQHNTAAAVALPDPIIDRAMHSIHEAVEVVIQYLEQISEQRVDKDKERDHDASPLTVAAVRVVCRFCAEAPDEFGPRMRGLAKWMINISMEPSAPSTASILARRRSANGRSNHTGGGNSSTNKDGKEDHNREPIGALFMLPMLLQVTHPDWGFSSSDSSEDAINAIRKSEQKEWFTLLHQKVVLLPLVDYAKRVFADAARAVTSIAEDAAHAKVSVLSDFFLRVITCNANINDGGASHHPSVLGARSSLPTEAIAVMLLMLNKLVLAVRQATLSGQSSFNRRAAKTNRPRIQTNRAVASGVALLSELWLFIYQRNMAEHFSDRSAIIIQAILAGISINVISIRTLKPQSEAYGEMYEWNKQMLCVLCELRSVSKEFDAACRTSPVYEAVIKKIDDLVDLELKELLKKLHNTAHASAVSYEI